MGLVERYLIKEIALTLLATLLVLLGIIMVQRLAMYLSQAANGLLSMEAILSLLGLQMLRFLSELLPLSFLIAVLLGLGRLYRDNEMTALSACGVGSIQVYRALLVIVLLLVAILLTLNFAIMPRAYGLQNEVQTRAREQAQLTIFRPGVFREILGGQHVVYIGDMSTDGQTLRQVFVRSQEKSGIAITTAATGKQEIDHSTGVRFLVLNQGQRVSQNVDGFYHLAFEQMKLRLDTNPPPRPMRQEAQSTTELFKQRSLENQSELHRRLAGPLSLIVLTLIAPALAFVRPREGRFARLLMAVFLYVIYFNLLGIGEAWIKKEIIPASWGLWWVHGVFLIGTAIYFKARAKV